MYKGHTGSDHHYSSLCVCVCVINIKLCVFLNISLRGNDMLFLTQGQAGDGERNAADIAIIGHTLTTKTDYYY